MQVPGSLVLCVVGLAGCAAFADADRDARTTALLVHKQTLKLKQAVREKVEAEERYYRTAVETLDKARELEEFVGVSEALATKARESARALRENPGTSLDTLPKRVETDAREAVRILDAGVAARREQREALRQNLQALRDLQSEYSALEQILVQLSTTPGQRNDLGALAKFIEQAADHYRKLDEAQRKAKKGTP
jgi:hypothetical protein